jgi:putative membrane protein
MLQWAESINQWRIMKVRQFVALAVTFAALQGVAVQAQFDASSRDVRFVIQAAQAGLLELELAQRALGQGSTQPVRDYGLMLAADTSGILGELDSVAEAHGIDLPTTLTRSQQRVLDRLGKLEGERLDRAVLNQAIGNLRRLVHLYRNEARRGDAGGIKGFAQTILPMLEEDLSEGMQLRAELF